MLLQMEVQLNKRYQIWTLWNLKMVALQVEACLWCWAILNRARAILQILTIKGKELNIKKCQHTRLHKILIKFHVIVVYLKIVSVYIYQHVPLENMLQGITRFG